ncbi:MAG TPA: hypothetical protein ENI42_03055 [Thermoplasmatales archaeon]|nr:hypothetical protein [Thermoplasmatales archaeon]
MVSLRKKAAEKLGLSEATVSQYLSKKRGDLKIDNKDILKEIEKSAKRISEENSFTAVSEICRICNLLKSSGKLKWCENHGVQQ